MAPHAESPKSENGSFLGALPNGFNGESKSKPNILFVIADQLSAPLLKIHDPQSKIQTPHIDRLAETGVVFDKAYNNSPLCAPSRFVMLTGQLPSKIGAYDNASPLSSDIPTFAHYLRREGYETTLAGKMHYIGKEQHHGFENRLTPDIYPADFGWTVNWDKPDERQEWYHNMSSVLQAGVAARTNQLDYDEEVIFKSSQYLYDHVRSGAKKRPFFLTVSMTHPHDPYAISRSYWDRYEGVEIPYPKVSINQEDQDPHSQRLIKAVDLWDNELPRESILRARRAYYGACSYVDDQVGKLLNVLKDCQLDNDTIVIFSSDHGDMLGERSMWYKMSWFENSARVPLVVNYPALYAPRRVPENVSTMDLLPSFVEMVGGKVSSDLPLDGKSFYPALFGKTLEADEAIGEYMGEGSVTPVIMIKRANWKYTYSLVDPPQLFNLDTDPLELRNLATDSEHAEKVAEFAAEVDQRWNLKQIHQQALQSQRQRRVVWDALRQGLFEPWDYQPREDNTQRYIRSTMPLDDLELRARYPPVDAIGKPLWQAKASIRDELAVRTA